jgi:hypothetical protein
MVTSEPTILIYRDNYGRTPLSLAARDGCEAALKLNVIEHLGVLMSVYEYLFGVVECC